MPPEMKKRKGRVVPYGEAKATLNCRFNRIAEIARLPKWVSPHVLRHSFATNLLDNGASLFDVKGLLGHSDIQSTMIYAHHKQDRLRDTLNGARL